MSADTHLPTGNRPETSYPSSGADAGPAMQRGPATAQLKASADQLIEDAKDTVQSQLNETKDGAAAGLHNVADALRDAAKTGSGDDPLLGFTASAADGLDRLSGALRNKDVSTMVRDMESFARAQPVAFFGLALAAGFLAVRYLKASQS